MSRKDYEITGRDMREGMSIGGWDMEWTIKHPRTGLSLTYQTHGSNPPQHRMRREALALLEMLVEAHYPPVPVDPQVPPCAPDGCFTD